MNRSRLLPFLAPLLLLPLVFASSGCIEDLTVDCGFDECIACEVQGDCGPESHCPAGGGYCTPNVCTPGERSCDGAEIIRCNETGSDFYEPITCESGFCDDGHCGCSSASDCNEGESCTDGQCLCPSSVSCGPDGICCAEGESCNQIQICEDGQDCRFVSLCQPACAGEVCGLTGNLCCDGDTPVCGPTGQCAPACDGQGQLCGENFDTCCPQGDVCVFGACQTPGPLCERFTDCDFGEYCDEALGRCMPDDFPDHLQCRMEGDFRDMEITEKWSWTAEDIISLPVVGDVTGDGQPNVVVNASRVNGGEWDFHIGQIVILDSAGNELRRIAHDPANDSYGSQGRANIALADLTGDGQMEIVYKTRTLNNAYGGPAYIAAVNGEGDLLWLANDSSGDPVEITAYNGAITVANFDGDPTRAQLVVGAMLIDHDGRVLWNEGGDGPVYGSNDGYIGGVAVVADLTGDGQHEIVTGKHAWRVDWQPSGPSVSLLWEHNGPDGYPAIADMNGDGAPEVVLVAARTVRILEGNTGRLLCGIDPTGQACQGADHLRTQPIFLPGPAEYNRGGPPTVADFDGDGRPEIGVAGGHYYTVFDFNRPSFGADFTPETIDQNLLSRFGQPQPGDGQLYIRWMHETQDLSSNTTGSSVFDFQGDGAASVIYADECFLRVYSGIDGEVELEIMNSTGTILEYPLVVDVDQNGRSEILVVANHVDWGCSNLVENFQPRKGLFVYEDPNDRWVRTRSVWNQHAYSIDNILDDGSLPMTQAPGWQTHNTFRANRQGEIPLNAADIVVASVQTYGLACPPDVTLQVTIQNQGIATIPAGLPVSLYDLDFDEYLETITIDEPISPGATLSLTFTYEVPHNRFNRDMNFMIRANDGGDIYDCNPDSSTFIVEPVRCDIPL